MKLLELDFDPFIQDFKAFKNLSTLGLPNKSQELFRRFNLSDIFTKEYSFKEASHITPKDYEHLIPEHFYYLIVINATPFLSHSYLPKVVDIQQKQKEPAFYTSSLSLLSESFFKEQYTLDIQESLDAPLVILHVNDSHEEFVPKSLLIELQESSKASVVEIFLSQPNASSFTNANRYFNLAKNAHLDYIKLQKMNEASTLTLNFVANLDSATLNAFSLDLGTQKSLNSWDVNLNTQEASFSLNALTHAKNTQQMGNICDIKHHEKHTYSNVLAHHILNNTSKALFDVITTVTPTAKHAKAHQRARTILLSDEAHVFNQPRLQIDTDELEASHGATVGELDTDALYYLQSRGLNKEKATHLLLQAFENEILEKIPEASLKEFLSLVYQQRL